MQDHCSHSHSRPRGADNRRAVGVVFALTAAYMGAEVVGGWLSHSLALLADAGHMLSDVGALGLSLVAMSLARRPAGARHTYGFHRAEILAALANAVALVVIAVVIFIEAYERWFDPPEVHGALMMGIATGGLLVNLAGLAILHRGRSESLNVRGAWLHVLGDALGSVGAMASGAVIWAFGWQRADPIASVAIGVLVLYASIQLLRESVHVLMAGAPAAMDVDDIRATIEGIDGVRSLHDLHVWTITSGMDCLSGHVVADAEADHQRLLATLQRVLLERFGVDHATLQIEAEGHEEVEPRF